MPRVFISYAKKDTRPLAEALHDALNRVPGLTAWMDKVLEADESWPRRIMKEIDRCDYFIVLLSPDVNREETEDQPQSFVINEIDYCRQRRKRKHILPVMVIETDVPVQIASIQYIDLTATPTDPTRIVARVCNRFTLTPPSAAALRTTPDVQSRDREAAETLRQLGRTNHRNGDYSAAIADLDAALRLEPNSVFALKSRGRSKHQRRDYPAAIADFDAALRLDPNDAQTRRWRDETLKALNNSASS